eukprot:CAMPEP_0197860068 /NCGR_PEP_ID=MMETSP1438-20131217/35197_1 /TAXON_ID=1461541 /ORGANISM="Pterosperma sp., Strain CCMP1384" /LENGTH=720 /DNA_ID=CAMNT_0043476801 /DNA_START=19 /DNA_END=2181 /DNA_ORIENTATION=-
MATKLNVRYSANTPALAILAGARLSGIEVEANPDKNLPKETVPILYLPTGEEFVGTGMALRYIARAGKCDGFYGSDALLSTQVDQWLDFLSCLKPGSGFPSACEYVNEYLALRTFLVGNSITAADVAIWGSLTICPQFNMVKKGGKAPHLTRWYDFVASKPEMIATVEQCAALKGGSGPKPAAGAKGGAKDDKGSSGGSFDIDLIGAEMGKVVTRFPPEPSGYLHIGHAKAAMLNEYFARTWKGKLIVRFDDTNPSKESDEFQQSIIEDLAKLGIVGDMVTHTSDHFDKLLEVGEKLIKEGKMYIDNTPVEQMRAERMDGIESKCRNQTVEKNMELWKEMVKGSEKGCECAARFKMDMKADNKTLRDPVAYRCNLTPHHQTGTKYKVYPTYDCACPYVDAVEGVTHALRTSEYKDREAQYIWAQKLMGVRKVHIWEYSRLNFVNTVLSKRKLQWFVDQKHVSSWTDPRFPTVQGICRRGMQVEALREFMLLQGASKNVNLMEWDKLWAINKKIIDPVCPRHTAVLAGAKVPFTLTNGPASPEVVIVPRHKKHPAAGQKATTMMKSLWLDAVDAGAVKEGEEITLMDWGNAFVRSIQKDASGAVVGLTGELHLEGSVKNTKLKVTWLPQIDDLVELKLVELGHLITKKKIEEEDDIVDLVNTESWSEVAALGDANMRSIAKGDVIQIERKGYYICDEVYMGPSKPLVLFNIPDGRTKGMMN